MENTDLPEIKLRKSNAEIEREARHHANDCLDWISGGGYDGGKTCKNMQECVRRKFSRNKSLIEQCFDKAWNNDMHRDKSCEDKLFLTMKCHMQQFEAKDANYCQHNPHHYRCTGL